MKLAHGEERLASTNCDMRPETTISNWSLMIGEERLLTAKSLANRKKMLENLENGLNSEKRAKSKEKSTPFPGGRESVIASGLPANTEELVSTHGGKELRREHGRSDQDASREKGEKLAEKVESDWAKKMRHKLGKIRHRLKRHRDRARSPPRHRRLIENNPVSSSVTIPSSQSRTASGSSRTSSQSQVSSPSPAFPSSCLASSRFSSQSSKSRTSSQSQSTSLQVSVRRAQVPQEFDSARQPSSTDRFASRSRENGEKFTEGNDERQKKSPAESLTSQASQLGLKVINLRQPSSDAKSASQFGENAMSASQFGENAKKFTEGDNENEEKLSVVAGPEIGPTAVHVSLGCPASDASKGSMEFSNKVFGRVLPVTSQNVNNSNASQGPGQNLHHIIENRLQPNTEGAGVQNMRLFGGIITVPIVCDMKSNELCSFFILTNPRELQFYENICCSTKKPEQENNHYVLQSYSIPLSEENLVKPGCGQLCSKGVMKGQVMKIMVQKFEMYWEGRGARMKMKSEVKAVSYHPP